MGIQGLAKLIADHAPNAIKQSHIKNYFGRKIAIDASMSLYQFLIAIRTDELNQYTLMNELGEQTSHLQGMFYRTIRMLDNGIKPVFVFDGRPPTLKSGELARRRKKRVTATEELAEAKEKGDKEAIAKLNKRITSPTPKHTDEAKKLLRLMGVPVIEAPTEAEAQCTAMVKSGLCYAVGSEDMDTLTLGAPILLRHLTYSEQRKMPILEFHLDKVLEGLGLSMDSFIDLCILLGCDYCDTIRGIGPKRAFQLIKQYGNIETILKNIDKSKYQVPEKFPFEDIRDIFKNPEVLPSDQIELKWSEPKEEELIQFLCQEKGFSEDRVRAGIAKLQKAAHTSVQNRITSFFKVSTQPSESMKQKSVPSNTNKSQMTTETKPESSISSTKPTKTTTSDITKTLSPKKEKEPDLSFSSPKEQKSTSESSSEKTKVLKSEKRLKKSRIISDDDSSTDEVTTNVSQKEKKPGSLTEEKKVPEKQEATSTKEEKVTNTDEKVLSSPQLKNTDSSIKIHPFFTEFQKKIKKKRVSPDENNEAQPKSESSSEPVTKKLRQESSTSPKS